MEADDVSTPVRDFLRVSDALLAALKQRPALTRHERLLLRTYLRGLGTTLMAYEWDEWQAEPRSGRAHPERTP